MMSYNKKYKSKDYYWGKEPSNTAKKLIELIPEKNDYTNLLDIGCGEGRNIIYFAKQGWDALGIDNSVNGLRKVNQLADENNVSVKTEIGDINNLSLDKSFDIIFSSGTIHYLLPENRDNFFDQIQSRTNNNGLNALNVFVDKPFIEKAPDAEENVNFFLSGQLLGYYSRWEILFTNESIFECNSGSVPHQHCMNTVIARKKT